MNVSNLDIILFVSFLSLNLILGLVAGRRVTNIRTYAVGEKDFSTGTLTYTIIATFIGGGFLFYALKEIYTTGWHFTFIALGGTLGLLIIGQVLSVRMGEFLGNCSVAEAMGDMFGKRVRIISSISGIALGIGRLALQFIVMGKIIAFLFGLSQIMGASIAATIVIVYSAFGGIRSVTITDVFQFITFSIFIPVLALIVWNQLKTPDRVIQALTTDPIFSLKYTITSPHFVNTMVLLVCYVVPELSPDLFQRIVMARSVQQARNAFTYAAAVDFLIMAAVIWISILLVAEGGDVDVDNFPLYMITKYAYPGLKGLIAVGICAMAMSTADSILNVVAVTLIHDIIKPLRFSFDKSITAVRMASLLVGVLAFVIGFCFDNLFSLVLRTSSFYRPIVGVPLLLAIFGFRSSPRAVITGMIGGVSTMLLWQQYFAKATGIHDLLPAIIGAVVCYMGSHYLLRERGGWVGIKQPYQLLAKKEKRRDAAQRWFDKARIFNVYFYLKENLPEKESLYSFLGIYVVGATYALFFTIPEATVQSYQSLYDFITHSILILAAMLITYPAWPATFRDKYAWGRYFIAYFWPLSIGYTLFFAGSLLMFMSNYHQVQVMIFMFNLIIAVCLLPWLMAFALAALGVIVGIATFRMYGGTAPFLMGVNYGLQFPFILALLFAGSLCIILARLKQNSDKLAKREEYWRGMHNDAKKQLAGMLSYRQELVEEVKRLGQDRVSFLDDTALDYIKQASYRLSDYLSLRIENISLKHLVSRVKDTLRFYNTQLTPHIITQIPTAHASLRIDVDKILQVILDSIYSMHSYYPEQAILMHINSTQLGHRLKDTVSHGHNIAAISIHITAEGPPPSVAPLYMSPSLEDDSSNEVDTCLLESRRIIGAHYGYTDMSVKNSHTHVIPVDVSDIRPASMELLGKPAMAYQEEVKHPLSVQLEKKLWSKLHNTSVDNEVMHKALEIIRKYHGGQKRKSGEPFFTHPMAVALLLLAYTEDQDALVAALLHDILEDTSFSMAQIKASFGENVGTLVSGVSDLADHVKRFKLPSHAYIHGLLNASDRRVLLIKLADRLHNMQTIAGHVSLTKQKEIAQETLYVFMPMARKLGLDTLSSELEKLSTAVLSK